MDLGDRLVAERRARLAAERLLELKSRELFAANRKLAEHARALSEEIVIQRRVADDAHSAVEELRGENARVKSDLNTATEARTVAEHRLWLALETIRDGFAIYDPGGRLVVANRAYMSVFDGLEEVGPGAHARDILRIGLEEGVFDPGNQTPSDWTLGMLDRWQQDPIEPRVIRLWNGHYIRLVDRRGADGGVVSLALDITDAVRRERQLRAARSKAEAANRAKSAFLANMSHELRTPMNGVVGMAELLAETKLSEEQRLYAETIRSSGEALLLIINDVLDYSKLEAEKLALRPAPFDLEGMVHEVATMLTPPASERGLTIAVDFDLFLPGQVVGDRGRLRQVLTNLAGNAVKFTESGHILIRVTGAGGAAGRTAVTVTVEDTGIGIAPEMQGHIFGEFNQVEDERNRKYEGTGLGLAISRQLVRLMGGEIWLTSELGRGSCFGFTVPLEAVAGSAPEVPVPPPGLRRALLIDGDPATRALLARQLRLMRIETVEAATVIEAAEAAALEVGEAVFADAAALAAPGFPPERYAGAPLVRLLARAAPSGAPGDTCVATIARPALRQDLFAAVAAVGRALSARAATADVEAVAPAPPTAMPVPRPETAAPPRRLRVLAAEDNRTNQLVFSKMLKDLPLEIAFAGNGREAVELFSAQPPHLVFMDISMPEMDGKEATRRIRAAEAARGRPRTPVIALTAHALDGDREDILAAGVDLYLTKPLKKSAIYEAIEACFPGFLARAGVSTLPEAPQATVA